MVEHSSDLRFGGIVMDAGGGNSTVFADKDPSLSEQYDAVKFGGVVVEEAGYNKYTLLFRETGDLTIPFHIRNRPFVAAAAQHRLALGVLGRSVGRITYCSSISRPLLSGWISGIGNARYFISSTHGFIADHSVTSASVCFDTIWEGTNLQQLYMLLWESNTLLQVTSRLQMSLLMSSRSTFVTCW